MWSKTYISLLSTPFISFLSLPTSAGYLCSVISACLLCITVRWGYQGDFWASDAETAAIRESLDFLHVCVTWASSDIMEERHGSPGGSVFITNEHLSLCVCEREISKVREGYRKKVPVASAALLSTAWHRFYPSLEAKVSACIRSPLYRLVSGQVTLADITSGHRRTIAVLKVTVQVICFSVTPSPPGCTVSEDTVSHCALPLCWVGGSTHMMF